MLDGFERGHEAVAIIFGLHAPAMLFLDRAQLKSRRASLRGGGCRVPVLWVGPGFQRSCYIWWAGWFTLTITRDLFVNPGHHTRAPMSAWQWVALSSWLAGILLIGTVDIRFKVRMKALKSFQVSRGFLSTSITWLGGKIGYLGRGAAMLMVTPDAELPMACDRLGSGVLLPIGLLDQLTRREVDALAARQLSIQSSGFYSPMVYGLAFFDSAVVALLVWLSVPPAYFFLICLSLLAVELIGLNLYLPHIFLKSELRALRLTGDAESYLSALRGLSRFTGTPLNERLTNVLARQGRISAERTETVPGPRETSMEERYPTSGSYMETGL